MALQWAVVATIAEPAPLTLAFVAHHLRLGASEVHIYLDEPKDPVGEILETVAGVRVVPCSRDHWRRIGVRRPKRQNNRQSFNATDARSVSGVPFMLSCDADEFLHPEADVAAQLAAIPDWATWMKVLNHERAFVTGQVADTIFDGVFKHHRYDLDETRLRCTEMTPFGFTGHAAGKPFVRTALGMNIGIHVPRWGHIRDRVVPPHFLAAHVKLLHFDGMTPLHWAAKFVRQAALFPEFLDQLPAFRIAQWQAVFDVLDDPEALRALYDRINSYAPDEIVGLEREGFMSRATVDPRDAVAQVFPGHGVDLSPAAFDAALAPKLARWRRMARNMGVFTLKNARAHGPGVSEMLS